MLSRWQTYSVLPCHCRSGLSNILDVVETSDVVTTRLGDAAERCLPMCEPIFAEDDDWVCVPGHIAGRDARRRALLDVVGGYDYDCCHDIDFLTAVHIARQAYTFVCMRYVHALDRDYGGQWVDCGDLELEAHPFTRFDLTARPRPVATGRNLRPPTTDNN